MDVLLADASMLSRSVGGMPAWTLVGLSVMAALYLTVRPRKRDPLAVQPFRTSLAQQKSLERDMQNVIVELSEMTRQMSAQLETRAAKLDALIREADAKVVELRQAVDRVTQETAVGVGPRDVAVRPAMRIVKHVDENPNGEDRWAEVYRLGEQGLSHAQIAQQLKRPMGEVELILALRPKSRSDALPTIAPLAQAPAVAEA